MTTHRLRIGTRGSPLALAQTAAMRDALAAAHGWEPASLEIVAIRTTGDAITDRPLGEVGGKGLFTRELDQAMIEGRIDLAVHSAKDLPTRLPDELCIAGYMAREDVRDALISAKASRIADLPRGGRVGTASLRRAAQVKRLRPDLETVLLRGNVETRLRKAESGELDATLLALAGLKRLGLAHRATALLPTSEFLPAVGQGAIAITARADDAPSREAVAQDRLPGDGTGADRGTRLPHRARRFVPHADRRPCAGPRGPRFVRRHGAAHRRQRDFRRRGRRPRKRRRARSAQRSAATFCGVCRPAFSQTTDARPRHSRARRCRTNGGASCGGGARGGRRALDRESFRPASPFRTMSSTRCLRRACMRWRSSSACRPRWPARNGSSSANVWRMVWRRAAGAARRSSRAMSPRSSPRWMKPIRSRSGSSISPGATASPISSASLRKRGHEVVTVETYAAEAVDRWEADLGSDRRRAAFLAAQRRAFRRSRQRCRRRYGHIAISADAAAPLLAQGWRVQISGTPDEQAMLGLLS